MRNVLFFLCTLICFTGCKKKSDTVESSGIHLFKGVVVTNEIGMTMGIWGTEDGDWATDANWTPGEFELLNFPDTIGLDGTFINDTSGWNIGPGIHQQPRNFVAGFPNPVAEGTMLAFGNFGSLKLKVAIVDKYYNRLKTYAKLWGGLMEISVDLSDSVIFQSGNIYRVYYSFSAKDSLNFYKGHGDILVCREPAMDGCKKNVP